MREIPMACGLVAIVDAADYATATAVGSWHAHVSHHVTYARRRFRDEHGRRTSIMMHAFLSGWPLVDHINGNGLDNRRSNLRPATNAQNMCNARRRADNTSGFKGVFWSSPRRKWIAQIRAHGHRKYLGQFDTPEQAALAYDVAAATHFGEYARLNFPKEPAA